MTLSSIEQERIRHINLLMSELHDSTNDIYEGLIDREFTLLKRIISSQIDRLIDLRSSIEDEV